MLDAFLLWQLQRMFGTEHTPYHRIIETSRSLLAANA